MKQQDLAQSKLADKSKMRRNEWVDNRVENVTTPEGQNEAHEEAAFVISCRFFLLLMLV